MTVNGENIVDATIEPVIQKTKRDTHTSGMAGEFFVMSQLYRLGLAPALTLGNSKGVDILVKASETRVLIIEVKTIKGGGKWPVGRPDEDFSIQTNKLHVLLLYKRFHDLSVPPAAYIVPTPDLSTMVQGWHEGRVALFESHHRAALNAKYLDRWDLIAKEVTEASAP